jgi:uncharacterized membrane protein YkvA (DUF1232 family)
MAARKGGRVAAFVMLARALRTSGRPGNAGIVAHLRAVPRMLLLGFTGRYPGLGRSRIVLAVLGVLYIVSPVDLMPELLLGIFGVGDDAFVAAWVAGALLSETDAFLRWESQGSNRVVVGEVVR